MHPQTAVAMGNLLQRLAGNPKTRAQTLELVKQVDPNYRLPADVEISALRKELADEAAKSKREEENRRAQNRRSNQRKKLVETHGEDVVKQIEEVTLKKYPNIDLEDAAKIYASDNGPARPTGRHPETFKHGQIWEFPDIPGLINNPEKAASDMAYSMIDEYRGRAA